LLLSAIVGRRSIGNDPLELEDGALEAVDTVDPTSPFAVSLSKQLAEPTMIRMWSRS
jgi:hypothetical protein